MNITRRDALLGDLAPPERRILREIVETAEVVRDNGHAYLTACVSAAALDALAGFEASSSRHLPSYTRM